MIPSKTAVFKNIGDISDSFFPADPRNFTLFLKSRLKPSQLQIIEEKLNSNDTEILDIKEEYLIGKTPDEFILVKLKGTFRQKSSHEIELIEERRSVQPSETPNFKPIR